MLILITHTRKKVFGTEEEVETKNRQTKAREREERHTFIVGSLERLTIKTQARETK